MHTELFQRFVRDGAHPCAMAKSVLAQGNIEFGEFAGLGTDHAAEATCRALYDSLQRRPDVGYWSFVALFPHDAVANEEAFEAGLWSHLQRMHDYDVRTHEWDPAVSSDPGDAEFSFSVGGRAWYVIGLHPQASRLARRLDEVALVFNPHGQFDDLRARGKYASVRNLIRQRDQRLQGSINPMLADHGTASEARQYSGREVPADWRCPFHPSH